MFIRQPLTRIIQEHFVKRKYVDPTANEAMMFLTTEVAEAMELLLSMRDFKRNHPEDKELFTPERFAEELGDIIYMAVIAGLVEGVDAIAALRAKIDGRPYIK